MSVSVGDKVTYVGGVKEERDKEFTVSGLFGQFAQLEGRDDFGPMVKNLRPYVEVGPGSWIAPPKFPKSFVAAPPRTIFIARDLLPEVSAIAGSLRVRAGKFDDGPGWTTERRMKHALDAVALWEFSAARDAEDAAAAKRAEAVREKRRDELAELFSGVIGTRYSIRNLDLKRAIDHIIDLEAAK